MFLINYIKLVLLLLPTFLPKSWLTVFLNAMITPLEWLYNLFVSSRNANIYRVKATGQVFSLRKILNDAVADSNGEIEISDGAHGGNWVFALDEGIADQLYIPDAEEIDNVDDGGVIIWNKETIWTGIHSFLVIVPTRLQNDNNDNLIRRLLNEYKLPGKSYTIEYN
jgi:hypothetical protein